MFELTPRPLPTRVKADYLKTYATLIMMGQNGTIVTSLQEQSSNKAATQSNCIRIITANETSIKLRRQDSETHKGVQLTQILPDPTLLRVYELYSMNSTFVELLLHFLLCIDMHCGLSHTGIGM